jgi:hypothetical protein
MCGTCKLARHEKQTHRKTEISVVHNNSILAWNLASEESVNDMLAIASDNDCWPRYENMHVRRSHQHDVNVHDVPYMEK